MKVFSLLVVLALAVAVRAGDDLVGAATDLDVDDVAAGLGKDALGLWPLDSTDELNEGISDGDDDAERFMEKSGSAATTTVGTLNSVQEADVVPAEEASGPQTVGATTTPSSPAYTSIASPNVKAVSPAVDSTKLTATPVEDSTPVLSMDVGEANNEAPTVVTSSSNSRNTKDVTHANIAGEVDPLEDAEEPLESNQESAAAAEKEEEKEEEHMEEQELQQEKKEGAENDEDVAELENEEAKVEAKADSAVAEKTTLAAAAAEDHKAMMDIADKISEQIANDIKENFASEPTPESAEHEAAAQEEKDLKDLEEQEKKEGGAMKKNAAAVLTKLLKLV